MPILQIKSPGDIPANGLAVDGGSVYAVRVVQFSAGATIAFDDPNTKRSIFGYFAYRNAKDPGWRRIWLTGSCIIEVATSPEESFGGSGVAGVNAIDQNQNTIVVGAAADGAAAVGNSVVVAGKDFTGLVRSLPVGINNQTAPNNGATAFGLMVAGHDGTGAGGALQLLPVCRENTTTGLDRAVGFGGVDKNGRFWQAQVDNLGSLRSNPANNFNLENAPAAATQATVTQAATPTAYTTVTDIEIEVAAGATASGILTVTLVSGAFTRTFRLQAPVNGIDRMCLSGLGWRMPLNTAATLAFSGAGPAGTFEKVSMSGYVTTAAA